MYTLKQSYVQIDILNFDFQVVWLTLISCERSEEDSFQPTAVFELYLPRSLGFDVKPANICYLHEKPCHC